MTIGHDWRFLPYLFRYVTSLEQAFSEDTCYEPVFFPEDPDEKMPVILELSLNEFTRLYSALSKGSELTYPEESHAVNWLLLKGVECPVDLCEIIQECIGEQISAIQSSLDAMSLVINNINSGIASSATTAPTPIDVSGYDDDYIYGGAMAVVQYMDLINRRLYDAAEESAVDNAQEWVANVLSSLPLFQELPFDELFELSNQYFQTAVASYTTDYTSFEEPAAFDLYCRIKSNNDTFNYELWGLWLENVETTVPSNAAAALFARYSPIRQTFLNQIVALLNSNQSLESYFADIYNQYFGGLQTGLPLPTGYSCGVPSELLFDLNPVDDRVTLNTDGGQWLGGDTRLISAPAEITVDLEDTFDVLSVVITAAYAPETGNVVWVEGVSYDLERGYWYGGLTYDYTASIPSVATDTVLIEMANEVVSPWVRVFVAP